MEKREYLNQYIKRLEQIELLKKELKEIERTYVDEKKQIKDELPVKIHYVHTIPGYIKPEMQTREGNGYITGFKTFNPNNITYITDPDYSHIGIVFPVIYLPKKTGDGISSREYHYPKYGTLKFWEIGKEDKVYKIYFGE